MKRLISSLIFMTVMFLSQSVSHAAENSYTLGPGDILEISVWKDESLTRDLVVPPDGVISYPLIGDIDVLKMTVTNLRKVVTERLSDYVPDATVTVMIKEINSLKAYVIGKVNNPGEFSINLNTTVMQILAMAHGLNPFAAESKVHILRLQNKLMVKIPFDYKQIEKGQNLKQNIFLMPGDTIVVP